VLTAPVAGLRGAQARPRAFVCARLRVLVSSHSPARRVATRAGSGHRLPRAGRVRLAA